MSGISYPPPSENLPIFDSTVFLNTSNVNLTPTTGLQYFLSYPNAQGTENLSITNVYGTLTTNDNIIMEGSGNYLQFPDGSQQTSAAGSTVGVALLSGGTTTTPQVFTGVNELNSIIVGNQGNSNTVTILSDGTYNNQLNILGNVSLYAPTKSVSFGCNNSQISQLDVYGSFSVGNTNNGNTCGMYADTTLNRQLDINGNIGVGNPTTSDHVVIGLDSYNSGQLNIYGTTDIQDNIIMSGTSGTNYLQFPDGTQQTTAVSTTGLAVLSAGSYAVPQEFTGYNKFAGIQCAGTSGLTLFNSSLGSTGIHTNIIISDANSMAYINVDFDIGLTIGSSYSSNNVVVVADDDVANQLDIYGTLYVSGSASVGASQSYPQNTNTSNLATIGYVNSAVSSIAGGASLSAGTLSSPQSFSGYNYFTNGLNMTSTGSYLFTFGKASATTPHDGFDITDSSPDITFTNNYTGTGDGQYNWNATQTITGSSVAYRNLMLLRRSQFKLSNCIQPSSGPGYLNTGLEYNINTGLSVYSLNTNGNTPTGLVCYSSSASGVGSQTDSLFYKITSVGTSQYDTAGNLWQVNPSSTAVSGLPNQISGYNLNNISPLSTSTGSQYNWYGYSPLGTSNLVQFFRINGGGGAQSVNPAATSQATIGVGGSTITSDGNGSLSFTSYNASSTNAETRMTLSTGSYVLYDLINGLQITIGQSGLSTNNPNGITLGSNLNMNGQNITNGANITATNFLGLATNATNVNVNNTSANATHYLSFVDSTTTGLKALQSTSGLTFNPNTNILSTTTFSGALSGTASTSAAVNTTSDNSATSCYIPFIKTTAGTSKVLYVDDTTGPLTYQPSTGTMSSTLFSGNLSGSVTNASTIASNSSGALTITGGTATSMTINALNGTLNLQANSSTIASVTSAGITCNNFIGSCSTTGLIFLQTLTGTITGAATATTYTLPAIFNSTYKNYKILFTFGDNAFTQYPSISLNGFSGTNVPLIGDLYGIEMVSSTVSAVSVTSATLSSAPLQLTGAALPNQQYEFDVFNVGALTVQSNNMVRIVSNAILFNPGVKGIRNVQAVINQNSSSAITGLSLQSIFGVGNNPTWTAKIYGFK